MDAAAAAARGEEGLVFCFSGFFALCPICLRGGNGRESGVVSIATSELCIFHAVGLKFEDERLFELQLGKQVVLGEITRKRDDSRDFLLHERWSL